MEVTDPAQMELMTQQALASCVGNKFDFKVVGHDLQLLEVVLNPGDQIIAESGSICYLEPDITFEAHFNDGSRPSGSWWENIKDAGKRAMAGASLSLLHIDNKGQEARTIAFSSPIPGHTIGVDLGAMGGSIMCHRHGFLCAAKGTSIQIGFTQRLSVGVFGGEGFFLQKLEGNGLAFLHACGAVLRRELREGEQLRVDTGCVVGFSASVKFDIARVGSVKTSIFGGEGIFFATLTGPGVAWIQSVPFRKFALKLYGEMPHPQAAGKRDSSD